MKKFAIGCLAVVGAITVVAVAIAIIGTVFNSDGTTETTTQASAGTTTPMVTVSPVETMPTVPTETTTISPVMPWTSLTTTVTTMATTTTTTTTPPTTKTTATTTLPSPTTTRTTTTVATSTEQPAVEVMLIQAQSQGLIEVYACGAGSLEIIKLSLTSKSADELRVNIRIGTIFESLSASIQGMVVIKDKSVLLQPYEAGRTVEVDAACYNMERDVPGDDDALALSTTPAGGDLEKLLSLPEFQSEGYRVQQFAIWTITDNPERDGYIGIGYFGMGSGPSDEEIVKIKSLFEKAGISTDRYKALS